MQQKTKPQPNNSLIPRPPIVVVMGHVDHGKTSILDYIRKSRVAKKEAGGITQHIGAYEIETEHEGQSRKITFIDTPGHAVLVVAADEGFKPQTKEALAAIKEEKMPFIIAANKIDKPNANIEKIKKECGENEIYIEEWGGEAPFTPVSAETGAGINDLLLNIILLSDLHNYEANPDENGSGIVIESHLDKRRGNTAALIIKNGTLKKKMFAATEKCRARVKIFENFLGDPIDEASFSSPVLITGFDCLPSTGEEFFSFNSKPEMEKYLSSHLEKMDKKKEKISSAENEKKEILKINLSLNADTFGSLEALRDEILKLENENAKIIILNEKIGNITEDDIKSASALIGAIIIGFNIAVEKTAINAAKRLSLTVKTSDIIYKLKEWLREEIEQQAPITIEEEMTGKAQIVKVFKKEENKQILGGRVTKGKIIKGGYFRVARKSPIAVFSGTKAEKPAMQGKIIELEKNKVKSDEAKEGSEFGIMVETKKEIKEGDSLEIYERRSFKKKIYD